MNNANLRNRINGHESSIRRLKNQGFSSNFVKAHVNYHKREIAALKSELNRRAAVKRAKAKKHWKTLGSHVGARSIVGYLQRLSMAPPTRGGAGYQRLMRQTRVGRNTKNVGTSMSPSPRRSPSPKRLRRARSV